jgi:hypothetical protein
VSDPAHPAGSIAAAIRKALPDFKDWNFDAGEAAARFFSGDRRDRLQATLPPGFAEGVPGAFIRGTRSLVSFNEGGPAQTVYELFKGSPDEQTFTNAARDFRISDVLDLTWMTASPLEMRSVQALLERLTSAVLPGTQVRFSHYDEPRYRSALQLYVGEVSARAAYGGVLAEWPGRPSGVDAAHLRIFLEPWATVESGQVVEFAPMPQLNRVTDPRPSEPPPAEPAGEHRP